MIKLDAVLNIAGTGHWSNVQKSVEITDICLSYINENKDFGELCVYFNSAHWDVNIDGLIYTDPQFLSELKALLNRAGYAGDDIDYSEQGMQGDDFVSFDVGQKFIDSFTASLPTIIEMV